MKKLSKLLTKKRLKKIVIILLFTELYLQSFAIIRYSFQLLVYQKQQTDILKSNWFLRDEKNAWWLHESQEISAQGHPFFGFIHKNINTQNIHFDLEGVRKTTGNSPIDIPGLIKIYFFGGSTMAGFYFKDEETLPSVATKILNSGSDKYLSVNYGQFGYASNNESIRLISLLKQGNSPNIVVFYDGCNDLILGSIDDSLHQSFADSQIETRLGNLWKLAEKPRPVNNSVISLNFAKSAFTYVKVIHYPVVAVQRIFSIIHPQRESVVTETKISTVETAASKISANYINNLKQIEQLAKVYKFKPIFIWQPLLFNKIMTDDERSNKYMIISDEKKEIYLSTTELLNRSNLEHFYDLSNLFQNDNTTTRFVDTCHITPEANTLLAKKISEIIQKEKTKK